MNTQNLLIHCPAKPGFNRIFDVGEYNMKLTGFGLLVLRAGESRQSDTGSFEVALVLLGGKCRVTGDGFDFVEVGGRKAVHGLSAAQYEVHRYCAHRRGDRGQLLPGEPRHRASDRHYAGDDPHLLPWAG